MTPAQKILEMIENVDPADRAAMDEIDARVWCWLVRKEYAGTVNGRHYFKDGGVSFVAGEGDGDWPYVPKYTRSRDALKAIRPEGWHIRESGPWVSTRQFYCQMWKESNGTPQVYTDACATEELAELHAIIQAIEWERNNGKI